MESITTRSIILGVMISILASCTEKVISVPFSVDPVSVEAEASEKETTQPKDNILKKTVKKIIQKREERYYKDDEE